MCRRDDAGGAPGTQDMAYVQTAGDEVEDLAALLAFAQQRFPVSVQSTKGTAHSPDNTIHGSRERAQA